MDFNWHNKLLNVIFDFNEKEVEKRLFCIATFIAIVVSFISIAINIHLQLHWVLHFIIGLGALMLSWIFILARYYKRYLIWEFILVVVVMLSGGWLYNDGPLGSINYLYILALIVFLSITKRKQHFLVSLIVIINLILLYSIYFLAPEWIHSYASNSVRDSDLLFTYTYVLFFSVLVFSSLRMNYENEKLKAEMQKEESEVQHKNIKDSINYAKDIQTAILQDVDSLKHFFKNYYIFWKPKDTIGGDFYIVLQHPLNKDEYYVAVADCTGHGVPGALLTMLGISFLNEIILQNPNIKVNKVLDLVREKFKVALSKGKQSEMNTDGMDMAVCLINKRTKKMEYSGSNRPLYLIRNNELVEFKPDRMPIGGHVYDYRLFSSTIIELQKNDNIVLTTDGYADQYGKISQRKFYVSKFKELLVNISLKPFDIQKSMLVDSFEGWRKQEEQTDDVLVFSFIPF